MKDHTSDCVSCSGSYRAMTLLFLAGGFAGAALALLLAPQSGKVTRQMMRRRLDGAADSARTMRGRVAEKLDDAAVSARGVKDQAISRGRELRDEAKHRVAGAASALAGKASRGARGNGDVTADEPSV